MNVNAGMALCVWEDIGQAEKRKYVRCQHGELSLRSAIRAAVAILPFVVRRGIARQRAKLLACAAAAYAWAGDAYSN